MPIRENRISPKNEIVFVSFEKVEKIACEDITPELIGEKGFGLAAVPMAWTLPYFVISPEVFPYFKSCSVKTDAERTQWLDNISAAMSLVDIGHKDGILVRSSSSDESIINRGHFHSEFGTARDFVRALKTCIAENVANLATGQSGIPLIVQKSVISSVKGHLSNEHRCSKEARDWLGEAEGDKSSRSFSVNLRNWRKKINVEKAIREPLLCNLTVNIPKALELAAAWASEFKVRSHMEWVWDGYQVFVVQIEPEVVSGDYDPTKHDPVARNGQAKKLDFLEEINASHSEFNKIKNVFLYRDLGLDTARVYVLSGADNIDRLAKGDFDTRLIDDLGILCASSLVIRTDLSVGDQSQRQMLPRTHEVRSVDEAKEWLFENSKMAVSNNLQSSFSFIFHNFIPAKSSAFAFAAPNERKVQVEALWGIPEGLYYNPHDKYVVDTLYSSLPKAENYVGSFKVSERIFFKKYCVVPSPEGKWEVQMIKENLGWRKTIPKDSDFLQYIACVTRKIAEKEGRSVSVMWFVDVPPAVSEAPCIPWFHEEFDKKSHNVNGSNIKKTPFDEVYTVESLLDISNLEALIGSDRNIRQICIRPKDEKLLRDKNTLEKVGRLAKRMDSIILMEGATLSHAYYQLQKTGALVSVSNAFADDDEKTEFNKLVRDKIPDKIHKGGESVTVASLKGELLLQALREKMVEEAIEVLDATDYQSIVEEIADLQEVMSGLMLHLGANQPEIDQVKSIKKEKAGAFNEGIVLLETSNPLPRSLDDQLNNLSLSFPDEKGSHKLFEAPAAMALQKAPKKWTDTRAHGVVTENLLNISIPLTLDSWKAESSTLVSEKRSAGAMKAEVRGGRKGSELRLSISIFSMPSQLDMFEG